LTRPEPYDEKIILSKVANGDEHAFTLLYNRWQPELSSFIFKITQSGEITAELVQDVFYKIWISRESLTEINNFKSYLYVISRNQAINAFRKTMREIAKFSNLDDHQISEDPLEENPEEEKLTLIDEAIDNLSPRQKEVYLLHRHHKLTYQEIADKLGIGKQSVKTHIELSVKSIRGFLISRIGILALLIEFFSENN
jgi:RNA polymerase sigma-70 factor (ECF subfamily)